MGSKITFIPKRVIVLSPEVQEILFALGAGKSIVGHTRHCDFPPESRSIPLVGDFKNPDMEKILSLKPDLVFVTDYIQKDTIFVLKKLKIRHIVVYSKNLKEMFKNISFIGGIFAKEETAERIINNMKDQIANLKRPKEKPVIFPLIWDNPVFTAGDETIINDVIETAGGQNISKRYGKNYFRVDEEFLLSSDIDIFLFCDPTINKDSTLMKMVKKNNPLIKIISQIHPDTLLRASPRLLEGIKELNRIIHEKDL